jgi:hypothetical protein
MYIPGNRAKRQLVRKERRFGRYKGRAGESRIRIGKDGLGAFLRNRKFGKKSGLSRMVRE